MTSRAHYSEYDAEPIKGLPGLLPAGEQLLWQGAPEWRSLALHAYHVQSLSLYFALMVLARGAYLMSTGASIAESLSGMVGPAAFAAVAIAIMAGIAAMAARSTVYTITSKRVVIRQGIALESTINLPFAVVESAALKLRDDGSGDLALTLIKPNRVSYIWLWPHVRPWRITQPQPALRSIVDAATAADILNKAFSAAEPRTSQTIISSATPAPETTGVVA